MALVWFLQVVLLSFVLNADRYGGAALTSHFQLDFADPTIMDYAQLNIESPMRAVTVSFWMRTTDTDHLGTPFSYAVRGESNALTMTDYNKLVVIINGEQLHTALSLNDGIWHHVVWTWSSSGGVWNIYVDGVLKDHGFNLSTNKPIPGKGIFVVGQEQDSFGGDFSSRQTFFGTLTQLNVWDHELTLQDVVRMRFSCEEFNGNVISWPNVQSAITGNLGSSAFCADCPVPVKPSNGVVNFTGTTVGSEADYQCDRGYHLGGNHGHKCLATGNWDQPLPDCTVTVCSHPRRVPNGYVIGKDFSYNKTIRIQCNQGYELVGSSTMACDIDGEWTENKPKCVACVATYFGENCALRCSLNCQDQLCNPLNGNCQSCVAGKTGQICDQVCGATKFGTACNETCSTNCTNQVCDAVTGKCISCLQGLAGDFCDSACNATYYGENCALRCSSNCSEQLCNAANGNCQSCVVGKIGQLCDQVCTFTTFGEDCRENCSTNCTGQLCDAVNGTCISCVQGSTGDLCDKVLQVQPHDDASPPIAVIVGPVVAVVVMVTLIIVGVLIWRIRGHKRDATTQAYVRMGSRSKVQQLMSNQN